MKLHRSKEKVSVFSSLLKRPSGEKFIASSSQNTNFIKSIFTEQFALSGVRIPTAVRNFNLLHKARSVLEPNRPLMKWILGSFLGLRQSGSELENLIPSSAEFKKELKYICNCLFCFHDLFMDKYIFNDFASVNSYRPI
jgi:hypothetical protein